MIEQNAAEEANISNVGLPEKHMTVASLTDVSTVDKGMQILEDIDPNEECITARNINIKQLRLSWSSALLEFCFWATKPWSILVKFWTFQPQLWKSFSVKLLAWLACCAQGCSIDNKQ